MTRAAGGQAPDPDAVIAALAAPAAVTPEVAAPGSQGEPGYNGLMPLPGAAAIEHPCGICGNQVRFDTVVPSPTWNAVIRAAQLPEYLCTTCIVEQFAKRAESFTCELWGAEFSGLQLSVHFNSRRSHCVQRLVAENTDLRVRLREAERAWQSFKERADLAAGTPEVAGSKCPKCGSPDRDMHPLTGRDDSEVRVCADSWHRSAAGTEQTAPAKIGESMGLSGNILVEGAADGRSEAPAPPKGQAMTTTKGRVVFALLIWALTWLFSWGALMADIQSSGQENGDTTVACKNYRRS